MREDTVNIYKYSNGQKVKLNKWGENKPNSTIQLKNSLFNKDIAYKIVLVALKSLELQYSKYGKIEHSHIKILKKDFDKLGLGLKRPRKVYENVIYDCMSAMIRTEHDNGDQEYEAIFNKAILGNDGSITLFFAPDVIFNYQNLQNDYLSLPIDFLKPLKNYGTIALYNDLKACLNKRDNNIVWKREINISNLREYFECQESYPNFWQFRERKILPAIKRINEHTDINILKHYKKRNCDSLIFEFTWSNNLEIQRKKALDTANKLLDEMIKK